MDSGTAPWQMWSRDNVCSLNEHRCRDLHLHFESISAVPCRTPCGIPPKRFPWEKCSVCICAGFELLCLFLWNCIVAALWFTCFVWVVSCLCMFATERDPRYHFDDWTLEIVNVSRRDGGDYIIECSNAEGKNHTKLKLDVHCEELKTNSDTSS